MGEVDRRALISSLYGSALLVGCRTVAGSKISQFGEESAFKPVIRKRWVTGGNGDHQMKYLRAVEILKENDKKFEALTDEKVRTLINSNKEVPPEFFQCWRGLVFIHEESCQHKNWFIFPYHRLYLLYFESVCQLVLNDATFAVPYWNWTEDRKVPLEFYDLEAFKTKRALGRDVELPSLDAEISQEAITEMLENPIFENFNSFAPDPLGNPDQADNINEGDFEGKPHDAIHNAIGGYMVDAKKSPTDPVFWLHHANIDRLWGMWIDKHPTSVLSMMTLSPEEDRITAGKGTSWGETEVGLNIRFLQPTGFERAIEMVDAGVSTLDPETTMRIQILRNLRGTPAPSVAQGKNNRGTLNRVKVKDLVSFDKLPYLYDTDSENLTQSPINLSRVLGTPAAKSFKPRKIQNVEGLAKVGTSQVIASVALDKILSDSIALITKDKLAVGVSITYRNIPIPSDLETRRSLAIYYFATRDNQSTEMPKKFSSESYKDPNFVGSQRIFMTHDHSKEGHVDAHSVSGAISLSNWLEKEISKNGPISKLNILAIALDTKNNFVPVSIFKSSDQVKIGLRISTAR